MNILKRCGMNAEGLTLFYTSKVRSILSYASPAWFYYLSKNNVCKLEKVQRSAFKIILPDCHSYEERLALLNASTLEDFILTLSKAHFGKILCNPEHPLHGRLTFNNRRTSSRYNFLFYLKKTGTAKRNNSFFPYFMSHFNSKQ